MIVLNDGKFLVRKGWYFLRIFVFFWVMNFMVEGFFLCFRCIGLGVLVFFVIGFELFFFVNGVLVVYFGGGGWR